MILARSLQKNRFKYLFLNSIFDDEKNREKSPIAISDTLSQVVQGKSVTVTDLNSWATRTRSWSVRGDDAGHRGADGRGKRRSLPQMGPMAWQYWPERESYP
jgi:hypothetical protein